MQESSVKNNLFATLRHSGVLRSGTLSFRLALTISAVTIALSVTGAWYFSNQQERHLRDSYAIQLQTLADAAAQSVGIGLANDDLSSLVEVSQWVKSYSELEYIMFFDPDGELISAFPENITPGELHQDHNMTSVSDIVVGGELFGRIVLTRDLKGLRSLVSQHQRHAIFLALVVTILGFVFALWAGSTVAAPLRRLSRATSVVARGSYRRVAVTSHVEEVVELTERFNTMVDEISLQTDQLVGANEKLVEEMAERERAETERRKLEERIQKSQKLESLGILAGGIAHDFNNLLVGVLGNASLMLEQIEEGTSLHQLTDRIRTAGVRLSDLTNQMLAYSGQGKFVNMALDLSKITTEMVDLLRATICKKARIELELDDKIDTVVGDPNQIRQIIMNLITNASDALENESGTITLRTGVMTADSEFLARDVSDSQTEPGDYCFVEISDTGCGITPESRKKMFDPFYSTKFTGRGLGLSAVLGIIRGHKGSLHVESEVGVGTKMRALFPVSHHAAPDLVVVKKTTSSEPTTGMTILIVDDEEIVRNVATISLKRAGFEVITAVDGVEGVEAYLKSGDMISAVLLDMMMPRMNGEETFREIIKHDPDAKVILSSGYDAEETSDRFAPGELAGFIKKPYLPSELVRYVGECIGAEVTA